jgi:hypothetical protein
MRLPSRWTRYIAIDDLTKLERDAFKFVEAAIRQGLALTGAIQSPGSPPSTSLEASLTRSVLTAASKAGDHGAPQARGATSKLGGRPAKSRSLR